MRSMLYIVSAVMFSTASYASDLVITPPDPNITVDKFNWTGAYIGAQVGYSRGASKLDYNGSFLAAATPLVHSPDLKGGFGGIRAGYNYMFSSSLVLGLEADANVASIKGTGSMAGGGPLLPVKEKFSGSLRLRAGYAFDRLLPFVTGGIAGAQYTSDAKFLDPLASVPGMPASTTIKHGNLTGIGWTLGAGIEYALTDNITMTAEYRYADYGKKRTDFKTFRYDATGPTSSSFWEGFEGLHNVKMHTSDLRVGLNYKL